MNLNEKQLTALRNLPIKGITNVHHMTVKFLLRYNLIEKSVIGGYCLTPDGAKEIGIELAVPDEKAIIARQIQDQIIDICMKHNVNMYLAVSQNMPSEIKVVSLHNVVYPEYLSELRSSLSTLKSRFNIAQGDNS